MQSKIKQITLLDGKQLFYPSEEEMLKLNGSIVEVIIEEKLSMAEYHDYIYIATQHKIKWKVLK